MEPSSQALVAAPASHHQNSTHSHTPSHKKAGSTFESLGLNSPLNEIVAELGYTEPTSIQAKAIPELLAGKDIVGLAQTGTGKTAAFLLPIIQKLLNSEAKGPRALIVVPTRELAEQVLEAARALSRGTEIRAMSMYGGVPIGTQKRALRNRMDIIVGCPGRILDLLNQRAFSVADIEYLVLDEADQMFDMGFIVPIRQLLRALPKQRQSMLFSATMPSEIAELTREALTHPTKIQVAPISSPATVTHIAYPVPAHLKPKLLTHLLKSMSTESVIVFTRTKHKARKLARFLEREGVNATSLQGNLSQSQRMLAMKGFRSGKYSVMVATDIASRGIDISSISHVINFDFPDTSEAYLHRTGRTGRAARNGDALTFITPSDESSLRRYEKVLRIPFGRKKAEDFDYSAKGEKLEDLAGGDDRPRFGGGRGGERGGRSEGRGGRGFGRSSGGRSRDRFSGRGEDRQDRREGGFRGAGAGPDRDGQRPAFGADRDRRFGDRPERGERSDRREGGNDRFAGRGGEQRSSFKPRGEGHGGRRFDRPRSEEAGPRRFDRSHRADRPEGAAPAREGDRPRFSRDSDRPHGRSGGNRWEKRGTGEARTSDRGPRAAGERSHSGTGESRAPHGARGPKRRFSNNRGPNSRGPNSRGPNSRGPRKSGHSDRSQ